MTEEEIKAIELLKEDIDYRESDLAEYISDRKYSNAERILINLVKKQQKEIEEIKNRTVTKREIMQIAKEYMEDKTIDIHEFYRKIMKLIRNKKW